MATLSSDKIWYRASDGTFTSLTTMINAKVPSDNQIVDLIYPVGAVYLSTKGSSPGSTMGKTWTAISGNRYVRVGTNTNAKGSNTITLDYTKIPSHRHMMAYQAGWELSQGGSSEFLVWAGGRVAGGDGPWNMYTPGPIYNPNDLSISHNHDSISFTHEPLYTTFYCWQRTA